MLKRFRRGGQRGILGCVQNHGEPTDLIHSVSRALRIIEQVAASPQPLPVKVIARRCEINLSTAYHLIRTLCYEGYLVRLASGGYVAGPKLAERFHDVMSSLRRPAEASAVLRHLTDVTGHSSYLGRISEGRLVVIDLVEGTQSPWLEDLQPGLETAAHATALGKALMTTLPCRARKTLLAEHGMRPFTPNTVTEPEEIEAELAPLRPGDMVVEHGEFRDGVCCAGVAIPGDSGWALSTTVRGLTLPDGLLTSLRLAAADLVGAVG